MGFGKSRPMIAQGFSPSLSVSLCYNRAEVWLNGGWQMRLISWNVNGIRAAHKKGFLEWFEAEHPDVLCIQETKAHEVQLPAALKQVEGYTSWFTTPERKGYSGVALYTREGNEPRSVSYGLGVERFDSEGRTVVADFDDFVFLGIYFPNGKRSADRLRYKMEFYDAFLDYVDKLRKEGRSVVVCGDVNTAHKEIDLARPKENEKISGFLPEERAWMDTFLDHGYVDTFRRFNQEPGNYSWWGPDDPRPRPERRLADRLFLHRRGLRLEPDQWIHTARRDGL